MSETVTFIPTRITDDQIKTAMCYLDAKTQCTENKELDFPEAFAASWEEMTADDSEYAETEDADTITLAMLCEWFREGLGYQHPGLLTPGLTPCLPVPCPSFADSAPLEVENIASSADLP